MKTLFLVLLFSLSSITVADDYYYFGPTILYAMIQQGEFETAEKLLKKGHNPNKKNQKRSWPAGETAVYALARSSDEDGAIDFLPTLMKYGADINAPINRKFRNYNSVLMLAAKYGDYRLAYALIKHGADVGITGYAGFNLLHNIALYYHDVIKDFFPNYNDEVMSFLDLVSSKVHQGMINTPIAVVDFNSEIEELMEDRYSPKEYVCCFLNHRYELTPFDLAIVFGHIDLMRALVLNDNLRIKRKVQKTLIVEKMFTDLNRSIVNLTTADQNKNHYEAFRELQKLSEMSYIVLKSLKSRDLNKGYRLHEEYEGYERYKDNHKSIKDTLSNIKTHLDYIEKHQTNNQHFSSLYHASQPIRDYFDK